MTTISGSTSTLTMQNLIKASTSQAVVAGDSLLKPDHSIDAEITPASSLTLSLSSSLTRKDSASQTTQIAPNTVCIVAPQQKNRLKKALNAVAGCLTGVTIAAVTKSRNAVGALTGLASAEPNTPPHVFNGETPTAWQTLSLAALYNPTSAFTRTMSSQTPDWNAEMLKQFFAEQDFEKWSLIPGALELSDVLIASKNGPLVALPQAQQIAEMQSNEQYKVCRPQHIEESFSALRSEFGSHYYFHGSELRNWHQIISQGAEPKSGTKMQANGACHGDGFYTATASWLSACFTGDTNTRIMGIVEVIDHPSVMSRMQARIVPKKVLLAVRLLAVYKNGAPIPDVSSSIVDEAVKLNNTFA